jgi:hypothetical protein
MPHCIPPSTTMSKRNSLRSEVLTPAFCEISVHASGRTNLKVLVSSFMKIQYTFQSYFFSSSELLFRVELLEGSFQKAQIHLTRPNLTFLKSFT